MKERLQKILSGAGICSRRKAETYILSGCVKVNGITANLGDSADPAEDEILVNGRPLQKNAPQPLYIMLNKPVGFVTTVTDDKGRDTVMELVSDIPVRIYPVGRLDYDTEGLLLMTNDGDLTYRITHPKNNVEKTYVAEVTGNVTMDTLTRLRRGVVIDGVKTSPAKVEVIGATQLGTKLEITIHEGRNRQVRKMFEAVGCIVKRLKRTREAGLILGHVPLGRWRKLTESEVNMLKKIGTGKKSSRQTSEERYGKEGARQHKKSYSKANRNERKPVHYSGNGIRNKNGSRARMQGQNGRIQSKRKGSGR